MIEMLDRMRALILRLRIRFAWWRIDHVLARRGDVDALSPVEWDFIEAMTAVIGEKSLVTLVYGTARA